MPSGLETLRRAFLNPTSTVLKHGFVAWLGVWLVGFVSPAAVQAESPDAAIAPISFNEQIRPLLSDRCFYCHGPDEKHREAGLRLDDREAAIDYLAIVPGDPDASLIIERVIESDDDLVMPPPHSKHGRLTADEVDLLARWIAAGALYEPHWAFAPLRQSSPPRVSDDTWPSNPIDRFVLARLESAGVTPSPEADRATLIRRLSLDLTGLLPTPDEVSRFEADRRPDAYERLVDSLLASPHFGERWGRHWLDQARYADSHGYSIDSQRAMWPYRDWVIDAIQADLPFDRFTIEQLAGDLLPDATKSQRVASGFHRNTLINQEGGSDPEQFRHEAVVDRVNTTGAVWLGLTVGCAQCHTHKFDPITDREYYQLAAFFNSGTDVNNVGATVSVTRGEMFGIAEPPIDRLRRERRSEREQTLLRRLQEQQRRADEASDQVTIWHPLDWRSNRESAAQMPSVDGDARLEPRDDGSLLVSGSPAPNASYLLPLADSVIAAGTPIAAIRLRVLADDSLPKRGPGRASNGNFVLTGFNLQVGDRIVRPSAAVADHSQSGYPVTAAIDGKSDSGWAINVSAGDGAVMNADHEAVFVFDPPVELDPAADNSIELHHQLNRDYLVGRFAIDVTERAPADIQQRPDEALIKALQVRESRRSAADKKRVTDALATAFPDHSQWATETESAKVMVMADRDQPRSTFISIRGDFLRPDESVGPLDPGGIAAVAPPLPADPQRNRLDLANWLVDPANPLTPRVTINRVWMRYFGRGLVETEEDFGTQGTPPSHPDLLDWLAAQWRLSGLSMKSLHRLIVTSQTYRQSSQHRDDLVEIDARNRLLARQNRIRVEAELVRDAALTASGKLDRTIGGPSVHPPQPDGVYAFTQAAKRWVADTDGDRFRRAMYTEFFRSAPHPLFTTFDAPDFQTVCTRRDRSNTPLQALTVANDEVFVELARAMAQRVRRESSTADTADQIQLAFQYALSRSPAATEVEILVRFHDRLVESFRGDNASEVAAWLGSFAEALAKESIGESERHAAALVAVCRTLFNTDNFITRE